MDESHAIRLIVILICLSGCASNLDTRYEIAFQAINIVDAYTTARLRHTPGAEEQNLITQFIIGTQPKEADVILLFITYGISHYMIARALPERWRRSYQLGSIAYSTSLVINNCQLGLC